MMSRIYATGSKVLIWLGHADKRRVKATLDLVCQLVAERIALFNHMENPDPRNPDPHYLWYADKRNKYTVVMPEEPRFNPATQRDHLIFLTTLFKAPWFERVWVIQEYVMASQADIYWGNASIRFDFLGEAAVYVTENYDSVFKHYRASWGLNNCKNMYRLRQYLGETVTFWQTFLALRNRQATDPRDKIYALLGLPISDRGPDCCFPMKPDYTLSQAEVYHTTARKLLVERQEVDVLAHVQHGRQIRSTWASWVPDWNTNAGAGDAFAGMNISNHLPANITIPEDCETCSTNSYDSISVKGFVVDTIQSLTSDYFGDKKIPTRAYRLGPPPERTEWLNAIAGFVTSYEKCFDDDKLANSLTGGHTMDEDLTSPELFNHMTDYHNLIAFARNPSESQPEYTERMHNLFNLVINTIARRRFFITGKRMLGLGPAAIEGGDVVVILFGGSVPFVLRPSDDGRHWRLVGECYVHDVMDSRAVDTWRGSGEPAMNFHLF
jgi:hypothetical protein